MEKWEIPGALSEHLMDAHGAFAEEMLSLSGKWRFYAQSADLPLPAGWETPDFNDKKWSRISVPGAWEAEGICQPHTGSNSLPAACISPMEGTIDQDTNLTGLYRKSFILSKDHGSRQIILRFESVSSCALLWVNGVYMGMARGMRTPFEFDITNAVCPDKNTVCIQVLRYSDATYLAPRGIFAASGLLGDVALYSLPSRAITHLNAVPQWQMDGTPLLHVSLHTRNADDFTARIALMDGNCVVSYCQSEVSNNRAEALLPCPDVILWCPDEPKLYRVAVILWDGIAMYHTRELTVGFRRAALENGGLTVNGRKETVFATVYRPFDPQTGRVPDPEKMEAELALLRQNHFNGILLNEPTSDALYGICDRLGLYVLDRSGVEPPQALWQGYAEDQNRRLATVHGNHPCVLAWNVSADHPGILPMEQIGIVSDPGPELLNRMLGQTVPAEEAGTVRRRRSAKISQASEMKEDQSVLLLLPRIPEETGSLIPLIRGSDSIIGAVFGAFRSERFLEHTVSDGKQVLTSSEGVPSPLLREMNALLQTLDLRFKEGVLTVTNLSTCSSTAGYSCRYYLTRDGEEVVSREVALEVGPGETKQVFLETQYDIFKAGRYHLTVIYAHRERQTVLAAGQWEVAHLRHIFDENPGGNIREDQGSYLLRSRDSAYTVNRTTGALEQITLEHRSFLTGPAGHIYASDLEASTRFLRSDEWEKLTIGRKKLKPSVLEVDHMTRTVSASFKLGSGLIQNCRLYSDGSMAYELRLRTGRTAPSLLGVCLPLVKELDRMQWFGLGPYDAAPRHQAGRFFGLHTQDKTTAASNGAKDPVYHLTVTDRSGFGLLVRSEDGLRASLRSASDGNLLRLEMAADELKPHTTYTFGFTVQPIRE